MGVLAAGLQVRECLRAYVGRVPQEEARHVPRSALSPPPPRCCSLAITPSQLPCQAATLGQHVSSPALPLAAVLTQQMT